ncbi:hypothetical protein C8D87_110232 [Lentzea atacamensis]|uniref:TIGR02678 family protein n=1 Tax=Lentzea atacamensis TaxID=531938 RepID=A0ABX9E271_9PSEU|nr:hypothetical protein [Lentzea atacamensis]RAS61284.1 hypothetical protein C8D87_110232 [Lentzea atacamensis]
MDDLFSNQDDESDSAFLARLCAFVAPVAHASDAVIKDVRLLRWAHAVYEAFGDLDETGAGLTVAELEAACKEAGPGMFESRVAVFKAMGMLTRPQDHAFLRRLLFNPSAVAALLVFERLRRGRGIQEILILLDETRQEILAGLVSREDVETKLLTLRRALSISAGELVQLRDRPVEELLRGRNNHRSADRLLTEARELVAVVESRFPELGGSSSKLITQALRYSAAANELVDRLLRRVSADRDFSMLEPEQYRTAALHSPQNKLAEVLADLVFDPADASITPDEVLGALERFRPRQPRQRPPSAPDLSDDHDPVEQARERRARLRERREATLRLHLRGQIAVDLTDAIRSVPWPHAIKLVTDVLVAAADKTLPFTVSLSDVLHVDATGLVSYVTPIRLIYEEETPDD